MTVREVVGRLLEFAAVASIFIQITPIKWNPISSLLKWVGSALNAGTNKRFDDLESKIASVNDKVQALENKVSDVKGELATRLDASDEIAAERNAVLARDRILRFGGEVVRGVGHTEEEFSDVLHCMDEYHEFCETHPKFPNNRTVIISKRIRDVYEDCLKNNSFIK